MVAGLRVAGRLFSRVPVLSDRVVLATLATFAVLTVFAPAQALESFGFTLGSLWSIAGFLLFSVSFAAYARASAADQLTAKVFATGGVVTVVFAASAFGVLSPFCSCGVVPIVAALLAGGAPLFAVMAFWMSSPLMDPEMFLLTTGELGAGFAGARLVAAFGMGLVAGYATWALQRRGMLENPLKAYDSCRTGSVEEPDALVWAFWREPDRRATFGREFRRTGFFLAKWLTLAFVLESLMVSYVPAKAVGGLLGSGSWLSVPLAVAVGVPTYLNGYAAIPTVGGLMDLGMSGGAALAFMTAGGVTSIPAAMAVFAVVKRRVFGWYLALALAGSVLAGFGYAALL
ncbi:MAG: permease [Rubrobacteraceae bacterium]